MPDDGVGSAGLELVVRPRLWKGREGVAEVLGALHEEHRREGYRCQSEEGIAKLGVVAQVHVERGKGDEEDEDHLADEERLVPLAELRGVGDLLHDRVDVERLVESLVAIAPGRARERRELSAIVNDRARGARGAERDGVWGSDRASTRRASCPGAHPRGGPRGREG